MAKKDKKKGKKKDTQRPDAVGAVRTAVERTFHATADSAQTTRTRAQDLVDEVAGAAGRLREMIEQIGVLEDLKKQVESLSSRVAALERVGGGASRATKKASGGTTRAKAKSSGGTTRAKAKSSGGTTRAKAKSSGGTRAKAKSSGSSRSAAKKQSSS